MQNFKSHQYRVLWSQFLKSVRDFFYQKDFIECSTPVLVPCPGTEPAIDFFQMESLFLRSSPELHLKKILASGEKRIFEIGPVFRKNEWTPHHRPQFTMLEWYRAFFDLDQMREDIRGLFEYIEIQLMQENRLQLHFEEVSLPELFEKNGMPLRPNDGIETYRRYAVTKGLDVKSMVSIDDYFFLIWTHVVEPQLNPRNITLVFDYPPFQAAYARLNQRGWGDRMEVYWRGLELGNAFNEVCDPNEQRERFELDNQKRKTWGKPTVPLDEEFLEQMKSFPPSVGMAMGLERLFMAFFKIEDISALSLEQRRGSERTPISSR